MFSNSVALIAAKVATMGLGFAFWVLAARLFRPADVGVAAGVVSGMMLCTQVALLGLGSAVITCFPVHLRSPGRLLNSALTLCTGVAVVVSGIFMLVATGAFKQLDVITSTVPYATFFLAASVTGTVGILLDQVSTTLRRGHQALARGLLSGGAGILVLGLVALSGDAPSSQAIFVPWVIGNIAAWLLGFVQLRRSISGYRVRPLLDGGLYRELTQLGLPNYALTLAERMPGLVLPVVVTELLSPAANATWYTIWMMAWVVYIVPIQVGMTLFAEVAHDPASLARSTRRGVRFSLGIGALGAIVLAAAPDLFLSLLGKSYVAAGDTPLRLLVLAIIPMTFIQSYFATCRATRRLGEAIATGWISGVLSVAAAAAAGLGYGLVGMAVAWVAVQAFTGLWSASRLVRLRSMPPTTAAVDAPGKLRPALTT